MNTLTIYPEQLTAMTQAELAALPAERLCEVHPNLQQLIDWIKEAPAKVHAAMRLRYDQPERAARIIAGKDFGIVRFYDGPICVTVDAPKRVSWDQKQLAEMAKRIAISGDRVEDYLDIEFSVPESRFTNWPTALREQFAPARTVKPGKRSFDLVAADDTEVA